MSARRVSTLAVLLLAPICVGAQTPGSGSRATESLARRVNERVRALQAEADRLAGQTRTLLGELRKLEIERDLERERAKQAEADAAAAEAALRQTTARLGTLEQERVEQLPDIRARLVELYKEGRGGYVRLLLSVRDLRELGRATRAITSLIHLNQERVAAHQRTLESVRKERAALQQKTQELSAARAEAARARDAAERAVAARGALIADIDRRRDLNAQLLGELAAAQQQLETAVANVRAGRPAEAVAVPLRAFRGALEWPVVGKVAARFGRLSSRPTDGTPSNGIEIEAPEGTPVRAIHGGTVGYADAFAGYGTLVIIDHGANQFSLYGYLASTSVQRDSRVDAGDELGRVGLSAAGPPALYLELRVDGRSVDPLQWLKPR